eukprot:281549_1
MSTWNHLRNSFRIVWVVIIHMSSIQCSGNSLLDVYNTLGDDDNVPSLPTQYIPTTINVDIEEKWQDFTDITRPKIQSTTITEAIDSDESGRIHPSDSSDSDDSNNSTNNSSSFIEWEYSVKISHQYSYPILSYIHNTSSYQEVFNPSWIPSSAYVQDS